MHANRTRINKTVEICMKRLFCTFQSTTNTDVTSGEKCSAYPTQQLINSSSLLNSVMMTLSLAQEKLCAITTTAKEVLQIRETSLQILSTLLGRMNNASQTGLWIAPLCNRSLQRDHMHQSTALIQQPLTIDEDSTLSIKLGRTVGGRLPL